MPTPAGDAASVVRGAQSWNGQQKVGNNLQSLPKEWWIEARVAGKGANENFAQSEKQPKRALREAIAIPSS